jgi:hypothetical protein
MSQADTEVIRRIASSQAAQSKPPPEASWWEGYASELSVDLSETARQVVEADARYIADRCVVSPGSHPTMWPATRLRRGLIVGSVQSGKTASMLALSALQLDAKLDVLVILSGTQLALWRQTYQRALFQLDRWTPESTSVRALVRALLPKPEQMQSDEATSRLSTLYHEHPNRVLRMLSARKPLIIIAMKQADHLMQVGQYLRDIVTRAATQIPRPLHMVVVDDEADDGSILDAELEASLEDAFTGQKQIPRHIARLWAGLGEPHTTQAPNLFATYVAYTATPQANVLQSEHNPLSPSDFVAALRTPAEMGSIVPPRSSTYAEPVGVRSYYCGGEIFYRKLAKDPGGLCVRRTRPERDHGERDEDYAGRLNALNTQLLTDALRAFFVAGALRLHLSQRRLSTVFAQATWPTLDAIKAALPAPHTMLYHPSARLATHFSGAEEISRWSRGVPGADPLVDASGRHGLDVDGLRLRLTQEEDGWRSWLVSYANTASNVNLMPNGKFPAFTDQDWPAIRELLFSEVFPYTRLAVVNSDPRASDRPAFAPILSYAGIEPPPNIYTLFVSGNVMSRGLTLEGLCTTLFLRRADEPAADTQMQMQRWFGYRGKHLPFCRVFVYDEQYQLFRAYHENDEAMRREIIAAMDVSDTSAPSPMVLQGETFAATRKLSNLGSLPLHPGPSPFVRVIETADEGCIAANATVLADLLDDASLDWVDHPLGGRNRGVIARHQLDLEQIAAILERFRYSHHDPNPQVQENARWHHLEAQLGLSAPEHPLFRTPGLISSRPSRVTPKFCPYTIAAYLRLWAAATTRHARGLFATDKRDIPWSLLSFAEIRAARPKFYVGVRTSGTKRVSNHSRLAHHQIRVVSRDVGNGYLNTTWGTRGSVAEEGSYFGDQLFDYHLHLRTPPTPVPGEPLWRRRGEPGLLLFHVIEHPESSKKDIVSMGLSIPHGGPDHFAALRSLDAAAS